jgi:hypothetical protein
LSALKWAILIGDWGDVRSWRACHGLRGRRHVFCRRRWEELVAAIAANLGLELDDFCAARAGLVLLNATMYTVDCLVRSFFPTVIAEHVGHPFYATPLREAGRQPPNGLEMSRPASSWSPS